MATLNREHRRMLENTVAQARGIAVEGVRKVLADQYGVHHHEPWSGMTPEDRELRNQLRAHGRQLGDRRDPTRETQEIDRLAQACAYEHWHRMLFARFLAENDLLLDSDHGMAMTLSEVQELAREQNRDWIDVAAGLAQRMLLAVFRPDDPALKIALPPETRQKLEEKLTSLPAEMFRADDSLGWVYQFWQRDEKERVNKSEVKIGADELPAVTQLFTEDYMVLFLLENTLGAWWTAKRRAEGRDPALPGYTWTYLRLNDDGSPAAGAFDGWPKTARDLRVLDPCMGSGHFLVFALPILMRMRIEEEALSLKDALAAVLRENLFGLEIDARCAQIAAFNLALASWRLAGGHFALPQMNLACSGLGINASEADWLNLAGDDFIAHEWMRRVYALFKDAPTLGSLIDPTRYLEEGQEIGFERVVPLIEKALEQEKSEETRELAIAAQGVLAAFRILAGRGTIVATNVPYLGRGKQDQFLVEHCAKFFADSKADLATCFVNRCLRFCDEGGSVALVTPQNWLFLTTYKKLRERLLKHVQWNVVARLGPRAFETISGDVVNVTLLELTCQSPTVGHTFAAWDASEAKHPNDKAAFIRGKCAPGIAVVSQEDQLRNPDAAIKLESVGYAEWLGVYAQCFAGILNGDSPKFRRLFWEMSRRPLQWVFQQSTVETTMPYGGREGLILFDEVNGHLREDETVRRDRLHHSDQRGNAAWGKRGVGVSQMHDLPVTLYSGEKFDSSIAVILPKDQTIVPALWAFCSNESFQTEIRRTNQKVSVENGYIGKVPTANLFSLSTRPV